MRTLGRRKVQLGDRGVARVERGRACGGPHRLGDLAPFEVLVRPVGRQIGFPQPRLALRLLRLPASLLPPLLGALPPLALSFPLVHLQTSSYPANPPVLVQWRRKLQRVPAPLQRVRVAGWLSTEYRLGRRERYLSPTRLYLVSSIIFFTTVALAPVRIVHVTPSTRDEAAAAARAASWTARTRTRSR
ncbi:MAG: DUF3667 domain-containing protein [Gemmatimonadetes bacterium]|nr:DUF3667 domain-containing protein [Gemmatimonadota bacterium]